jgi:hypothetical protein
MQNIKSAFGNSAYLGRCPALMYVLVSNMQHPPQAVVFQ